MGDSRLLRPLGLCRDKGGARLEKQFGEQVRLGSSLNDGLTGQVPEHRNTVSGSSSLALPWSGNHRTGKRSVWIRNQHTLEKPSKGKGEKGPR